MPAIEKECEFQKYGLERPAVYFPEDPSRLSNSSVSEFLDRESWILACLEFVLGYLPESKKKSTKDQFSANRLKKSGGDVYYQATITDQREQILEGLNFLISIIIALPEHPIGHIYHEEMPIEELIDYFRQHPKSSIREASKVDKQFDKAFFMRLLRRYAEGWGDAVDAFYQLAHNGSCKKRSQISSPELFKKELWEQTQAFRELWDDAFPLDATEEERKNLIDSGASEQRRCWDEAEHRLDEKGSRVGWIAEDVEVEKSWVLRMVPRIKGAIDAKDQTSLEQICEGNNPPGNALYRLYRSFVNEPLAFLPERTLSPDASKPADSSSEVMKEDATPFNLSGLKLSGNQFNQLRFIRKEKPTPAKFKSHFSLKDGAYDKAIKRLGEKLPIGWDISKEHGCLIVAKNA